MFLNLLFHCDKNHNLILYVVFLMYLNFITNLLLYILTFYIYFFIYININIFKIINHLLTENTLLIYFISDILIGDYLGVVEYPYITLLFIT